MSRYDKIVLSIIVAGILLVAGALWYINESAKTIPAGTQPSLDLNQDGQVD